MCTPEVGIQGQLGILPPVATSITSSYLYLSCMPADFSYLVQATSCFKYHAPTVGQVFL